MKRYKYIILLVIVLSAATFNCAQNCKVKVSISTDFPNSMIFVDDSLVGSGNVEIYLTKGKYVLYLDENSDRYDSKSFRDTLLISDCSSKHLDYKFRSGLYLNTDPSDVYVYKVDSLIGHTPLFISASLGNVQLTKPGYKSLQVDLAALSGDDNIKLQYTGMGYQESFVEGTLFKLLIGGIVSFGAATAYYKIKADKHFDDYQFTGDKGLLDQTRKYDLVSGITFTALQLNFGILLYYFLID